VGLPTKDRSTKSLEAGLPRITLKFGRSAMPSFEVSQDSRMVKAMNDACRKVRGRDQPTGAITPPGYHGTDAAHFDREAWKASLADRAALRRHA